MAWHEKSIFLLLHQRPFWRKNHIQIKRTRLDRKEEKLLNDLLSAEKRLFMEVEVISYKS